MTVSTAFNLAGCASFVIAVIYAMVSRCAQWPANRSAAGLSCALWALSSSLCFIGGAL